MFTRYLSLRRTAPPPSSEGGNLRLPLTRELSAKLTEGEIPLTTITSVNSHLSYPFGILNLSQIIAKSYCFFCRNLLNYMRHEPFRNWANGSMEKSHIISDYRGGNYEINVYGRGQFGICTQRHRRLSLLGNSPRQRFCIIRH